jgi:adenylate cyclase
MLEESTGELDELLRVIETAQQQVSQTTLEQVLEAVTRKISQLLKADRATLFLVDQEAGMLRSKVAQHTGDKPLDIIIPISRGIAGHVARTGETLNIPDAYQHERFDPKTDRETGYRTRSILCMPIYNRARRVFAVAQLLNRLDGQPFDARDEQRFREFAAPLGLILETCCRSFQPRTDTDARG